MSVFPSRQPQQWPAWTESAWLAPERRKRAEKGSGVFKDSQWRKRLPTPFSSPLSRLPFPERDSSITGKMPDVTGKRRGKRTQLDSESEIPNRVASSFSPWGVCSLENLAPEDVPERFPACLFARDFQNSLVEGERKLFADRQQRFGRQVRRNLLHVPSDGITTLVRARRSRIGEAGQLTSQLLDRKAVTEIDVTSKADSKETQEILLLALLAVRIKKPRIVPGARTHGRVSARHTLASHRIGCENRSERVVSVSLRCALRKRGLCERIDGSPGGGHSGTDSASPGRSAARGGSRDQSAYP
jgi:hypothetical protein